VRRALQASINRPIGSRTPVTYRRDLLEGYQPDVTALLPAAGRRARTRMRRCCSTTKTPSKSLVDADPGHGITDSAETTLQALLISNCAPLSFIDMTQADYMNAMLGVYEACYAHRGKVNRRRQTDRVTPAWKVVPSFGDAAQ
jgi:hypothetical protein